MKIMMIFKVKLHSKVLNFITLVSQMFKYLKELTLKLITNETELLHFVEHQAVVNRQLFL